MPQAKSKLTSYIEWSWEKLFFFFLSLTLTVLDLGGVGYEGS